MRRVSLWSGNVYRVAVLGGAGLAKRQLLLALTIVPTKERAAPAAPLRFDNPSTDQKPRLGQRAACCNSAVIMRTATRRLARSSPCDCTKSSASP